MQTEAVHTALYEDPVWGRVLGLLARYDDVHIVGGTIRDALLGRTVDDLDVVVPLGAQRVARELADELGGAFVPLDVERDMARVVLVPTTERHVDVAALRGPNLTSDLAARDLTVNALACAVRADGIGPLVDPTGGYADLLAHRLRHASPDAFVADPLRVLRAVRLKTTLAFDLAESTRRLMMAAASGLRDVSPERIRDELLQILASTEAHRGLQLVGEVGALEATLPELVSVEPRRRAIERLQAWRQIDSFVASTRHVSECASDPGARGSLSIFGDALAAHVRVTLSDWRPRWWLDKLALALMDVPDSAGGRARALKLSNAEVDHIVDALRGVMLSRDMALDTAGLVAPLSIYRFYKAVGASGVDAILLWLTSERGTRGAMDRTCTARTFLEGWFEQHDALVDPPHLVSGRIVMGALGLDPGPAVGVALEALREAQVNGAIRSREDALALLRTWASSGTSWLSDGHPRSIPDQRQD